MTRWSVGGANQYRGINQYQSTMDAFSGAAHAYVMGPGLDRIGVGSSLVAVIDDDESMRESLPDLLKEFGLTSEVFSSAEEFLSSDWIEETRCLILDVAMPGMSGPELQRELKLRRRDIPIVFITGQQNETIRLRVLEQGAVECLSKPFSDTALLNALKAALRAG